MKWYGKIGYAETEETSPGIWEEKIVERKYYGEIIRRSRRLSTSDKINDDISVNVEISIIADQFLYENFHTIAYIEYYGGLWKVSNVEPQRPRLLLTLGGLYNEEQTGTT